VSFAIEPSTVFILADSSGSGLTTATTGSYFSLRDAVLQAISALQADAVIRFGFGTFAGSHPGGDLSTCNPIYQSVPIGLNNGTAVSTAYSSGPLIPFGTKSEGPASAIIPMVKAALQADTAPGAKYMLFVTDGQSDFCDDGNNTCPPDAVTYELQDMKTANLGTVIFGVPSNQSTISAAALQNFANAGAGQTVANLPLINSPGDLYYQCMGITGWKALWTAVGRTGVSTIASYGTPGGVATVFGSSTTTTLLAQAETAIAGLKSCTFSTGSVHIDPTKLASAGVTLGGQAIPQDATDGWTMPSNTVVALNGAACNAWRTPTATIAFQFPCDTIGN
jgi:hypothetical protein